jgi:formylglycine-generating enzyme required for sulfatase activity
VIAGALIAGAHPCADAQEPRPSPGAAFRDCGECPEMIVIPAGRFIMGSPRTDRDANAWEQPQRDVTVAAFVLGKFEVTFAEYDACVADGGCTDAGDDRNWGRGRQPVIGISWNAARAYAAWLSTKTGKRYRLASEAEWEYAARAGAATRFAWGDERGTGRANCSDCEAAPRWRSAPAGSYAANAFGLHDMHGNVWEWVADCANQTHAGAPADSAPRLSGNCAFRVLRGGSWNEDARSSRAAARSWLPSDFRGGVGYIGFRIARDLD